MGKRVLVCKDDDAIRVLLDTLLHRHGSMLVEHLLPRKPRSRRDFGGRAEGLQ